ncbi:MAG: sugar nucleotide-binding protein [Opitutales bacterium]|nr:sugar nucleotide-binding protein [Opitutales bacterium]
MFIVLGATGYLGSNFVKYLQKEGGNVCGLSRAESEYTNVDTLISILQSKKPDFLINAAGFTGKPNVDACELAKAECLKGNAVLPGVIREVCEDLRIPWGHVSSGCIYSGRRADGEGWTEEDEPNFSFRDGPCSFYSGTKALGEEVLAGAENCFVWRLRIPFNEEISPRNYIQKLVNYDSLLEAENSVSHLDEFVEKCVDCFEKDIEPGVYNMTNQGPVTTRQVTEWMIEEGVTDKGFKFFENEEQFMQKAAKTPRSNCVLDTSKAEKAGIGMRPVEEAMRDSMRKMAKEVMV